MSNTYRIEGQYLFFYGGWPSNFHTAPFQLEGRSYFSVEQWMMAEKARVFRDEPTRERIMRATLSFSCKRLGRQVQNYDEPTWVQIRRAVVLKGSLAKYSQNPPLLGQLRATGTLQFVEASPYDRIWGIGVGLNAPNLLDTSQWGQNLLGQILDEVRATLTTNATRNV